MYKELVFYLLIIFIIMFLTSKFDFKNIITNIIEAVFLFIVFYYNNIYYSYFIIELMFVLWISKSFSKDKLFSNNLLIIVWFAASAVWLLNILSLSFEYTVYLAIIAIFVKSSIVFAASYKELSAGFVRLNLPLFWCLKNYISIIEIDKNYMYTMIFLLLLVTIIILFVSKKDFFIYTRFSAFIYFCLAFLLLLFHGEKVFITSSLFVLLISFIVFLNTKSKWLIFSLSLLIVVPPSPLFFIFNNYKKHFYLNSFDVTVIIIILLLSVKSVLDFYKVVKNR